WHLGDDAWYPDRQGFDFNFGGCDYGQPPSYFDPYRNKRLTGIPTLPPRKEGEYLTDREADEAVRFIRKHKNDRFFLHLAHYAVHTPIQAKAEVTAKYKAKPKPWQGWPKYAAMIEAVDDAVGRVMATLDELDLTERTLVIFTSDNGGLLPVTNNAPLRSGKGYAYEGGIRVPLLIRGPGIKPGVSRKPVTTVDLFATVMEAVRLKQPTDGVSVFKGRKELYWHFPHYRHKPGPYSIIRVGNWKLIRFWEGPVFELYDLANDLSEKNNLAAAQPDRVKELDRKLLAHLERVEAKLPKEK
ncbi:MAG: sulfatase-like hydrolase/transferase, partial [Planctomycetota bacterium]|nr:sulfatase-like hydrolase/transferase [Planctomycetota bacterium]